MNAILHSSIFRRFILLFLCVAVPILGSTLILIQRAEHAARTEMSQSMEEKDDYFIQGLEAEYARVVSQHESLALDYDLMNLSYRSASLNRFGWFTSVNRLQEKLRIFKDTSAYIHVMSIYMLPMMRAVSSQGGGRHTYDFITEDESERIGQFAGMGGGSYIEDGRLSILTTNRGSSDVSRFVIESVFSGDSLLGGYTRFVDGIGCFLYNEHGLLSHRDDAETARIVAAAIGDQNPGEEHVEAGGRRYIVIKHRLNMAGLSFVSYCDEDMVTATAGGYRVWLWAAVALFFILTCVYAYMTHVYLSRPVMTLLRHFELLEGGDMDLRIEGKRRDEFGLLFERFNHMVERLNSFIQQSYMQTIYLQRAELKQLQAQINPHFLYNSYFLLHRLIKAQDPHALEFSGFLGEYFKYITKNAGNEVALEREDAHARNYANIQARRFEGRVRVEFDVLPPEMKGLAVPPLILQPLLENAFLHGLDNLDSDGLLKVTYAAGEDAYRISVSNNGVPIGPETLSGLQAALADGAARENGIAGTGGLTNIHRRLRLAFGPGSGLEISSAPAGEHTLITVEMSIKRSEAHAKAADS